MSRNASEDDQSEDGELRQSPLVSFKSKPVDEMEDEDLGDMDSLDIKPPQARVTDSRLKKKSTNERSHHSKTAMRGDKRSREDRHSHREKHHRDKPSRSQKHRDHYQRERDRYYKDKQQSYEQMGYTEQQYMNERAFRERKSDEARARHDKKYQEDKSRETRRDQSRDANEKHKRHEEDKRASKALADLRERITSELRLIEKRKGEDTYSSERHTYKRFREPEQPSEGPVEGEAENYVREIIYMTSEERKQRREHNQLDVQLTEDERFEQEQRREKLLEADREMARLKERSKAERERRHIERALKRKKEDEEEGNQKKTKVEEPLQVVMVSDGSDQEEDPVDSAKSESENDDDEEVDTSERSRESRSLSRSRSHSRSKSYESGGEQSYSEKRSRSKSHSSRSRSGSKSSEGSQSRSKSRSPDEDDMLKRKEDEEDERDDTELEVKKEEGEAETETHKIDEDLPPYYPAIQGCRSVEEFQCLNRIEEGTYGVVYRARDKRTEEIVALKRLKMEKEKEGFPITSLREINTLLKGQHSNIVTVREIVVGSNMDKIFIVMDYVEHDLKSLMETMRHKKQSFMPGEVKCLLKQLLQAVAHLHDNWIIHRDLKTSNLLLSHKGILKVGDFGLAREYGSPLKAYTPIVVTLWYRAPELLLCSKEYSTPIDIWSVGCIFAELLLMNTLFPGKSEVDQLNRIFKELGTPSERIWTGYSELPAVKKMKFHEHPVSNLRAKFNTLSEIGLGLLLKFLTFDPSQRITAEEAMKHAYFSEPPLPIDPAMFPTWPAKSELGHKRAMAASPKPPSGGGEYKKLGGEDDDGYGFRLGMGVDLRRGGAGFSLKF
ncbi:hypothetical protein ABEB36_011912 [Hypothenemus hampei]|uniref:cyclin-dependent kinase n=1 Tax=Hypothenemus hampei TaxID=57062 RepID=A0ABD1E9K0_HYPHA